jgi:hypothetical protein
MRLFCARICGRIDGNSTRTQTIMELKTFVEQALVQIVDAVVSASEYTKSKGALVNPRMAEQKLTRPVGRTTETISAPDPGLVKNLGVFLTSDNRLVDMVEFDVAVTALSTAEEAASLEGGLKASAGLLRVVSAEVGGKSESSSALSKSDERVSHVKFRIPLALPQQ